VITVGDGLSALTSVADEMPAVILLDIQLPRMDGYQIWPDNTEKLAVSSDSHYYA